MSVVLDAVSSVVGAVADVVGTVAETVVNVADTVIQTVADNPLLIVAAIAAPYALGALAADAGAGIAGVGMDLGATVAGSTAIPTAMLDAAVGATTGAIGTGATALGVTGAGIAGGAGAMGISAAAMEAAAVGTALGTTSMASAFAFPSTTEATNFGTSILDTTNSSLAVADTSQMTASNVLGNQAVSDFATTLNPMVTEQATNAVNLVNSGMPYGEAISSATNGAVNPNPIGEIFTNSTTNIADTYNTLSKGAQSMMQNMGQTILPDANPLVQKFVTNTAVNTALNGGDVTKALEGSALGMGTGLLGNEVTGLTSDTLGNTGSKIAGNAASSLATGAVTGQNLGDVAKNFAIGTGFNQVAPIVNDITGSPTTTNALMNTAKGIVNGQDIGSAVTGAGIGALTSVANNALGSTNPNSVAGALTNIGKGLATQAVNQAVNPPVNATQSGMATKPQTLTSAQVAKLVPSTQPTGGLPTTSTMPAQKVDVSTLTPITNISNLSTILGKKV